MGLRQYELRSHVIAEGINQSVRNESNIFLIELSTKKGPKTAKSILVDAEDTSIF